MHEEMRAAASLADESQRVATAKADVPRRGLHVTEAVAAGARAASRAVAAGRDARDAAVGGGRGADGWGRNFRKWCRFHSLCWAQVWLCALHHGQNQIPRRSLRRGAVSQSDIVNLRTRLGSFS